MSRLNVSEPAKPYSWYSGGGYVLYSQQNSIVRLTTSSLYYPNGGGFVWTSMPSYRVIDTAGYTPTDPFSGGVLIGSYTETGIGEGAEVELGFANAGDYVLSLGGNPREYTAEEKNFGSIINKVTVKSIGRAYQTPILWISGTTINHRTKSGDPLEGEYARTVNGQEYWARESSLTIAYSLATFDIPSYVSAYPSDYGSRIREYYLNSINGYGEGYTYGAFTGNNVGGQYVQGTRFTAALPDGFPGKVTNNTPADASKQSWWEDFKTKFWESIFAGPASYGDIYFVLMYGPNGAKAALDAGQITPEQFNLLKGYYGSQFLTGTVFGSTTLLNTLTTNGNPLAVLSLPLQATVKNLEIVISTALNAGHQLGQAWKNYVNSRNGELLPTIELYDVTPSKQDYTGAFTAQSKISTAKNLLDYIYDELDDFKQQTLGSMKTTASKPDFAGFSVKNTTYTTRNPLNGNTITFTFDSNGDWMKTESSN